MGPTQHGPVQRSLRTRGRSWTADRRLRRSFLPFLQTLVLARNGILVPEFSSIEEYLGRNTEEYYSVLGEVGAGRWNPDGDARPWVQLCLIAHYRQAQTLLRRVRESKDRWAAIERITGRLAIADRAMPTLFIASMGFRIRNASYGTHADVSELVASRDLRALVEQGWSCPQTWCNSGRP